MEIEIHVFANEILILINPLTALIAVLGTCWYQIHLNYEKMFVQFVQLQSFGTLDRRVLQAVF